MLLLSFVMSPVTCVMVCFLRVLLTWHCEEWKMRRESSLPVVSASSANSLQSATEVKMRTRMTLRPFSVQ